MLKKILCYPRLDIQKTNTVLALSQGRLKLGWQVGVGARLTDKPYIKFLDMEHKNVFSFHDVPL